MLCVQSSGHVILMVHEPAQDAQVHHLEELQVVDSEDIDRAVDPAVYCADDLHHARSHHIQHVQLTFAPVIN